jgi:hypothetical protein
MDGNTDFLGVLEEVRELHKYKSEDYGSDEDCFSNIRSAQDFGISPWLGAMLRANDKVSRLKTFARRGTLKCESVEDSLIDLANYAIIALIFYRQEQSGK